MQHNVFSRRYSVDESLISTLISDVMLSFSSNGIVFIVLNSIVIAKTYAEISKLYFFVKITFFEIPHDYL